MRTTNIALFKAGWMIGDFEPSILRTKEFDFAHHHYPKGFVGQNHAHMKSTEYNYIVKGKVMLRPVGGEVGVMVSGDMFIFDIGEYCGYVEYLEDTDLIIIKAPTGVNDKVDATGLDLPMPK